MLVSLARVLFPTDFSDNAEDAFMALCRMVEQRDFNPLFSFTYRTAPALPVWPPLYPPVDPGAR